MHAIKMPDRHAGAAIFWLNKLEVSDDLHAKWVLFIQAMFKHLIRVGEKFLAAIPPALLLGQRAKAFPSLWNAIGDGSVSVER